MTDEAIQDEIRFLTDLAIPDAEQQGEPVSLLHDRLLYLQACLEKKACTYDDNNVIVVDFSSKPKKV